MGGNEKEKEMSRKLSNKISWRAGMAPGYDRARTSPVTQTDWPATAAVVGVGLTVIRVEFNTGAPTRAHVTWRNAPASADITQAGEILAGFGYEKFGHAT
jgi:hypothetical protein